MIYESRYEAAGIVAGRVATHFQELIRSARNFGEENLAPEPYEEAVEEMIDVAFWASLQREEGYSPKISLAYFSPEQNESSIIFEKPLPFSTRTLTQLSPGVERAGIHLCVWKDGDELFVWGTTLKIPNYCFVLDVSEPGLLVIKHRRIHGFGKFANVAVLMGDQIKLVDTKSAQFPGCPPILKALLGVDDLTYWNESVNILVALAVSMRAHKHGGILLVVPENYEDWKKSIIQPMKYSVNPYKGISNLIMQDVKDRGHIRWQEALKKEVESIAGLTAVDGATVINDRYELLTFGVKITRSEGRARVEQIAYTEPIDGGGTILINPSLHGGTRHLAAAQFVNDQHNAISLVASQDGHFTLFSWSEESQIVHAYRLDTLLL